MPPWNAGRALRQLRRSHATSRAGPRLRRLQFAAGKLEPRGPVRRTARWATSGQSQGAKGAQVFPSEISGKENTGHRGWASHEHMHTHLERLTRLYRNVQLSYTVLGVGAALCTAGLGFICINWGMVRTGVSRESAGVISETIRDERIQFSAQEFSKELLNQLLNDEEVAKIVGKWVYQLLVSLQDDIGALFVRILQQEQVIEGVNHLADRLVAYLCASTSIQEKVGGLLVDAICLQASRDAAAAWAYDLVMREDVTCGFRDLVVAALQMDEVVREAQALALQVLQDPDLVSEAKRTINETLRDSELRATAKESLWNIVVPWSTNRTPDKKRTLKLIDELVVVDSLTQEERQSLRSLQARMKGANGNGTNGNGVAGSSEAGGSSSSSSAPIPDAPRATTDAAQAPPSATPGASFASTRPTGADATPIAGAPISNGVGVAAAAAQEPRPPAAQEPRPPAAQEPRPPAAQEPQPPVTAPVETVKPPVAEVASSHEKSELHMVPLPSTDFASPGLEPTVVPPVAAEQARPEEITRKQPSEKPVQPVVATPSATPSAALPAAPGLVPAEVGSEASLEAPSERPAGKPSGEPSGPPAEEGQATPSPLETSTAIVPLAPNTRHEDAILPKLPDASVEAEPAIQVPEAGRVVPEDQARPTELEAVPPAPAPPGAQAAPSIPEELQPAEEPDMPDPF